MGDAIVGIRAHRRIRSDGAGFRGKPGMNAIRATGNRMVMVRRNGALIPSRAMGKHEDLLARILRAEGLANIDFNELRGLLAFLGFTERIRGSHHVFSRAGVPELLNLQPRHRQAKVYQVRQVRWVILRHGLHLRLLEDT